MSQSEIEKRQLEEQAAKLFCQWYSQSQTTPMEFLHLNDPSRPDTTCALGQETVDIEIAHLYGTQQDAMQILGKDLDSKVSEELATLEQTTSTAQRLLHALNRILYNKAQKHYDSERVWLVIRNAHPAWQAQDIRQHCQQIQLATEHPFQQIWILGDWQGNSGAVKIFPNSGLQSSGAVW